MKKINEKKHQHTLEPMEPRLLFSAGLEEVLATHALTDTQAALNPELVQQLSSDAPASSDTQSDAYISHELVFIDTDTPDYQQLVDDLLANQDESRRIGVVLLDNSRDGIEQVTDILAKFQNLDAVHIISHGSSGAIDLGGSTLDGASLEANAELIKGWSKSFTESGDLLIYGCNLAASEEGQALVDSLAALTDADVSASGDLTGSAEKNGDWELEYSTGQIETAVAVSTEAQANFESLLAVDSGAAVWSNTSTTPQTSTWDGNSFGTTSGTTALPDNYRIMQGADAPTRDEKIVVGIDASGNVTGTIWDGSSWTTLPLSMGMVSENYWWGANVAYEQLSGDAVVVWNDNTQPVGSKLRYAVWDGTSWSTPQSISAYTGAEPQHMKLAFDPSSDAMVLVVDDVNADDYALVWDGDAWGNRITLDTTGTAEPDQSAIAVSFEAQSGNAMVIYGKNNDANVYYRIFDGTSWSSESVLNPPAGATGEVTWLLSATDYNSDRIVLGTVTSAGQAWLNIWDGTAWQSSLLAETTSTGTSYPNLDVSFESSSGQALAVYGESGQSVFRYRTWDAAGGWSGELTGPNIGAVPNSMTLDSSPSSDHIMLSIQDANSDVHYLRWNGSGWGADNELTTNSSETKNQPFVFIYDQDGVLVDPNAALDVRMLITTKGDVNNAGTPNLQNWTSGTILGIADPNLQFEDGNPSTLSGGTFTALVNLDDFTTDNNVDIRSLHYVSGPVTVGAGTDIVDLLKGDILFVTATGETLTSTNSLSFAAGDIIAYRPDAFGNYSSGTFLHVLDNPSADNLTGISLVQKDIWVGDAFLEAGDLLYTHDGRLGSNIYHYSVATAGAGTTSGTISVLIDGTDIDMGTGASNKAIGVALITEDMWLPGHYVPAGSIITSVAGNDGKLGDNGISVTKDDFFYLTVTSTGQGTTSATATLLYEGNDVGLDGAGGEKLASLTFIAGNPGTNLDPKIISSSPPVTYTENAAPVVIEPTAIVTDGDSTDFDGGFLSVSLTGTGTVNDRLAIKHQGFAAGQIGVVGNLVFYSNMLIGSFSGGTDGSMPLTITFTAGATAPAVQNLIRAITYENVSDDPDVAARVVKFQMTDGDGGTSNLTTSTINVVPVNDAPSGTDSSVTVTEDIPYVFSAADFGFSDIESDGFLAVTITTLQGNGTLTRNGVAVTAGDSVSVADINAGLLIYTPDNDDNGANASSFTFQVHDDGGRSNGGDDDDDTPNTITIDITPVVDISNDLVVTNEDTAGMINVMSNDSFGPGATVTSVTQGSSGSVSFLADGTVTYTPSEDFNGSDSFTYTVTTAAGNTETATVNVTINSINDTPTANSLTFSTPEDQVLIGTSVLANDNDSQNGAPGEDNTPLTAQLVSGPSNGTLALNADGTFVYTPNSDFNGSDSFTYQAIDSLGGVSNTATVTISVSAINDAAIIGGDISGTIQEDINATAGYIVTTGILTVTDADTNESSFIPGTQAGSYGTYSIDSTGSWSYQVLNSQLAIQSLGNGEAASEVFTVNSVDGTAQNITFTINGTNDTAVVTGTITGEVTKALPGQITTTSGQISISDIDASDNPAFNDVGATVGDNGFGSFVLANGSWTYTLNQDAVQHLNSGDTATDTITYTATDGSPVQVSINIISTFDNYLNNGSNQNSTSLDDAASTNLDDYLAGNPATVTAETDGFEIKESEFEQNQNDAETLSEIQTNIPANSLKYIVIPTEYGYGDSDHGQADDSHIRRTMQVIEQMSQKASNMVTDILQMFDLLRIQISAPDSSANNYMSQSISAIMLSLSAGMVTWATRGGTLLASMISAVPLWKGFDPLPIIAASRKKLEENGNTPEDMIYNEQVDGMFDDSSVSTDSVFIGNTTEL